MSTEMVIQLAGEAIYTILKASLPLMLTALGVGLLIGILQATTQIQEQTLVFIPKIIAVFVSALFFGPWILNTIVDFTEHMLGNLYRYIG